MGLAQDALAQALVWLTRHHGHARSLASLLEGQQVSGQLGPDQAVRALREAQWQAALVQRPIAEFSDLLLPVVLLLKNGDAVILLARRAQAQGPALCTVVMPGADDDEGGGLAAQELTATEAELAAEYAGVALVASPKAQTAPRTAAVGDSAAAAALRDPGSHWLWGTVRRFVPLLPVGPAGRAAEQHPDAGDRPGHLGGLRQGDPAQGLCHPVGAGCRRWPGVAVRPGLAPVARLPDRPGRQEDRPAGGHAAVPPEPECAHGTPAAVGRRLQPCGGPARAGARVLLVGHAVGHQRSALHPDLHRHDLHDRRAAGLCAAGGRCR